MELYKEILAHALAFEQLNIHFPTLKLNAAEIVCVFEEMGSSGGGRHDFG